MDLQKLQEELLIIGQQGNSDVVMRGLIVMDQVGSLCRFITHDQTLNPTVRPHESPSQETHAAGHAIVQLMTLVAKRGIDVEEAINMALQDIREGTVLKKQPSDGILASGGHITSECVVVHDWHGLTSINRNWARDKILVTDHVSAEVPAHLFCGIITNQGGMSCHAAIVARERGIPCIVGMGNATDRFTTGQQITIDNGKVIVHV